MCSGQTAAGVLHHFRMTSPGIVESLLVACPWTIFPDALEKPSVRAKLRISDPAASSVRTNHENSTRSEISLLPAFTTSWLLLTGPIGAFVKASGRLLHLLVRQFSCASKVVFVNCLSSFRCKFAHALFAVPRWGVGNRVARISKCDVTRRRSTTQLTGS